MSSMLPSLLVLSTLLVIRPSTAPGHPLPARAAVPGLRAIIGGRWLSVSLVLGVATLRVVPVLGVPLAEFAKDYRKLNFKRIPVPKE